MTPNTHSNNTERLGRWLGKAWRAYARRERQAMAWLLDQGCPRFVVVAALWGVRFAFLGLLAHLASWVALVLLFIAVVFLVGGSGGSLKASVWAIGAQEDHKKSVFYDPRNYNDDPDPRFDGE